MMQHADRHRTSRQHGTSLTELLITLLILCISVVAISVMMNESIRSLTSNIYHQRAARLAGDLAEQLAGMSATAAVDPLAPAFGDCINRVCDADQFLAHLLHRWHGRVGAELPAGRGDYTVQREHGLRVARINVNWRARGGATLNYTTSAPLYAAR